MINSKQIRQKFLDFFAAHGHTIIPSASIIPENDPTVLFTTAGMHPLVPYLLGQTHPAGNRLASAQKCIRTGDIDEVGDLTHLTFFEMLGNWSLGDYFKQESIAWSWEFLTSPDYLNLDKAKLAFSVFAGDQDAEFDQDSYNFWLETGVSHKRIAKLAKTDNWWGPAGQTGPCGPDTEIFYWTPSTSLRAGGSEAAPEDFQATHADSRWVEIWNNVFMAYDKQADGSFASLKQKNVDTGMGLERTLCTINNISDIYQTDLFDLAIAKLEELSGKKYKDQATDFRIIADHLRAATVMIGDQKGIVPSNKDQGYVLRRLIRRAMRAAKKLGINQEINFCSTIAQIFIDQLGEVYPELIANQPKIVAELNKEETKFKQTLQTGEQRFNNLVLNNKKISGVDAFDLYQSYGFPIELTRELAKEKDIIVDEAGFVAELERHKDLSRTATAGKFKGGLADHAEATTKLHTAVHLLLAALRKVLGDGVFQKGSNITVERLRLDFSYPDKMTPEQIKEVEGLVNQAIKDELPVTVQEMPLAEAKAMQAMGVFDTKYGQMVKVYTVGQGDKMFSCEICGGPHASNTGELGSFKIIKEEASSAGVRRIKATLS